MYNQSHDQNHINLRIEIIKPSWNLQWRIAEFYYFSYRGIKGVY